MKRMWIFIGISFLIVVGLVVFKRIYKPYKPNQTINLKSENQEITLFLDYKFGMSSKEFEDHTQNLIKKKSLDNNGKYYFNTPYNKSTTSLKPEFYNGKLYELNLFVEQDIFSEASSKLLYLSIAQIFTEKYHFKEAVKDLSMRSEDEITSITIMDIGAATVVQYQEKSIAESLENERQKSYDEKTQSNINDI